MKTRRFRSSGFTLVEVLLAVSIAAMVSAALAGVVHGLMRGYGSQREEAELHRGGSLALGRMRNFLSTGEGIIHPAAEGSAVDTLVFWAGVDDDGDYRVNEDPPGDESMDGYPGLVGVDDDGDGLIDEDKMGREPGDPGYGGWVVGEGITALSEDDDEDGRENEDAPNLVIYRRGPDGILYENLDGGGELPVAQDALSLNTVHSLTTGGSSILEIEIVLTTAAGQPVSFRTAAYPGNSDSERGERAD